MRNVRNRATCLGAGALLLVSGVLLVAASWQRWASACPWGTSQETDACLYRQDDRYGFLAPGDPWVPVGSAAELAGTSLLLLAAALLVLPWAMAPRRKGSGLAVALGLAVPGALACSDLGLATLRSGLTGRPVEHVGGAVTVALFVLAPVSLYAFTAATTRVPLRTAAAVPLVLASPLFAVLYSVGPYDDRPWWEAVSGAFTALGGLCLLVSALWSPSTRRAYDQERGDVVTGGRSPAP